MWVMLGCRSRVYPIAQAKAAAVFINATPGRLQLMRHAGKKMSFPKYSATEAANIRLPDLDDAHIVNTLVAAFEQTKAMLVPPFRDGECDVRPPLGMRRWPPRWVGMLGNWADLRQRLHQEPHVRGLGYGQYRMAEDDDDELDDADDIDEADEA